MNVEKMRSKDLEWNHLDHDVVQSQAVLNMAVILLRSNLFPRESVIGSSRIIIAHLTINIC